LSVDGAWSTKEKRDWSVLGIGSLDDVGTLYIRNIVRERIDPKEVVDMIVRLQERYKFTTMLIGKGAYEKGIGPFLKDELNKRGKFLHVEAIPEVIDKRLRAQSIRGRMRAGGVKFNKKPFWYPDFEQEMLEFDRGTHDDQVDMMSLFGLFLDQLQTEPTIREIKDMQYEEEFGDSFTNAAAIMGGRSEETGY
jgi:predicted phage terminase large subunit-like protein